MMKKSLLILIISILLIATGCGSLAEKTNVSIAVIKGPTGVGAVRLMAENEAGHTENTYTFTISSVPDAIVAGLLTADFDIAALPTNMIAMLYAKTDGAIQCLAVNTLSTLYLLEKGDTVLSANDLAGKSIVCYGQGTTVQATIDQLFQDADIHYVSEHTEAVAQAAAGKYSLVIVPEPFVTTLLAKDDGFRIALDIGELWKERGLGELPMGGIAVRKAFAAENSKAVEAFLREYAKTIQEVNDDTETAATLAEQYDLLPKEIAKEAIPRMNITCISTQMKDMLAPYYEVLMDVNPALIGGKIPGDDFYLVP